MIAIHFPPHHLAKEEELASQEQREGFGYGAPHCTLPLTNYHARDIPGGRPSVSSSSRGSPQGQRGPGDPGTLAQWAGGGNDPSLASRTRMDGDSEAKLCPGCRAEEAYSSPDCTILSAGSSPRDHKQQYFMRLSSVIHKAGKLN